MTGSQGTMPAPGPIGHNLIDNLREQLKARGLSFNRASAAMQEAGRPMPPLAFSRIMKGERRVDVDEATTLAEVLDVTLAALLAHPGTRKPASDHAAVRAAQDLAGRIGKLLAADDNLGDREELTGAVGRGLRKVALEVEELLAERRTGGTP